jgi:hypothetical protein
LQLAFATLIADRAIEWVINQEEFHHAFLRFDGLLAVGADDHALRDRCRTGWQWLRCFFNLYQAHTAVRRDGQFFVVTKVWDVGANLIGSIHYGAALLHFYFFTVYFDFNHGFAFVDFSVLTRFVLLNEVIG